MQDPRNERKSHHHHHHHMPKEDWLTPLVEIPSTAELFPSIVITDLHLARFSEDYSKALADLLYYLKKVIAMEKAESVFILGDLFQSRRGRKITDYIALLKALEDLGVEMHVIPGNHDRWAVRHHPEMWTGKNVHFHVVCMMHFGKFYLSHDLHQASLSNFVLTVRSKAPIPLPADAMLLLGHMHCQRTANNGLTQIIPPFTRYETICVCCSILWRSGTSKLLRQRLVRVIYLAGFLYSPIYLFKYAQFSSISFHIS